MHVCSNHFLWNLSFCKVMWQIMVFISSSACICIFSKTLIGHKWDKSTEQSDRQWRWVKDQTKYGYQGMYGNINEIKFIFGSTKFDLLDFHYETWYSPVRDFDKKTHQKETLKTPKNLVIFASNHFYIQQVS